MASSPDTFAAIDDAPAPAIPPRLALLSMLGFWAFYFLIVTIRGSALGIGSLAEMLGPRTFVALVGVALTYFMYLAMRAMPGASLGRSIAVLALLAIPAAFLYSATNWFAFRSINERSMSHHGRSGSKTVIIRGDDVEEHASDGNPNPNPNPFPQPGSPPPPPPPPGPGTTIIQVGNDTSQDGEMTTAAVIADNAVNGYFFFVAWAAIYLALCYAAETRVAERRAARFRAAAQSAEIRALRYQVNPHFLFNTLNSLSSLVLVDRREEAERMILNLSTFFRTSLTADPAEDHPLSEEVRLQGLYLEIERVRFPERLIVDFAVPKPLESACVPALILQPLIENAIKYGVSRSRAPVTIRVEAREDSHGLVLSVCDDGAPFDGGEASDSGTGLGLRNVRDRLAARFGAEGSCRWGPRPEGGFIVTLHMPVVRNGC